MHTYRLIFLSILFFTILPSTLVSQENQGSQKSTETYDIISKSNPRITTHHLTSGTSGFQIGITSNAGGIINEVVLPGLGDIMGFASDMYGRAGQVAIRDRAHGGRYNPTQAGFNETLGSKCTITQSSDKKTLIVEPRPLALWHGDGKYDFTRWENIGDDPYKKDAGKTDEDGLYEEYLLGKQLDEVKSEFDYYGTYEDLSGKHGITTAIIRHYYQISFIRPPGHCINQHRVGTKLWKPNNLQADISVDAPEGLHEGTDKDMSNMLGVWSLRHDRNKWIPKHVYYRKNNGKWKSKLADGIEDWFPSCDNTVFISADSDNPSEGKALGLYRPKTEINREVIIGINETNGSIVYTDKRDSDNSITYNLKRVPKMSKYGFMNTNNGMINRTRLDANIYEAYRNEVYILYGTPKEIMDAIAILDVGLGI
jgi:hypothetical protein